MQFSVLSLVCLLCGMPALLSAQAPPNFSGTWTRVDAEAERASVAAAGDLSFRTGNPGSGWGSPITIWQDGKTLRVEYEHFTAYDLQPPIKFTYSLDGSDSSNTLMIGHTDSKQHSRVAWRDSTLVITTTMDAPDLRAKSRIELLQALTLEA